MSWSSEASKDCFWASRKKPLCVKRLCFLMFPLSLPFLEKLVDFLYCLLETTRKYPLMLLFPKQPGFCILLLQAVYPLQSLRAMVGWEQGRPHSQGLLSPFRTATNQGILTWEASSGQGDSTVPAAARVTLLCGLAHHPGPGPSSCIAIPGEQRPQAFLGEESAHAERLVHFCWRRCWVVYGGLFLPSPQGPSKAGLGAQELPVPGFPSSERVAGCWVQAKVGRWESWCTHSSCPNMEWGHGCRADPDTKAFFFFLLY